MEDLSLLYYVCDIQELKGIFDTQIAHRMCYEDEHNCSSIGTKNISISLGELLNEYFHIPPDLKEEIHDLMSKNQYLWKTRPISDKLNYYAGCDVLYLPKIYEIICDKIKKKIVKNLTIKQIINECNKYLQYVKINKRIKNYNVMNLSKGTKLQGLIKNIQNHCVFIQLNIGFIGIVDNYSTVMLIKEKFDLGDIINFRILTVENSKKRLFLDIEDSDNSNNFINEKIITTTTTLINDNDFNKINENNKGSEEEKKFINNENLQKKVKEDEKDKITEEGLNINKESFFPKSYLNSLNNKNNINNNININSNNRNNSNNNVFPLNEVQDNNNSQKENMLRIKLDSNNYSKGWFYNDNENVYYYNQNENNNNSNGENDNSNSDLFYYTLNPFPDSLQNNCRRKFFDSHKYK